MPLQHRFDRNYYDGMTNEKPYSNLLLIDATHIDYLFYLLCNRQVENEKLQSVVEFEKSDEIIEFVPYDIDLYIEAHKNNYSKLLETINSFEEEMSQQLEDIRFKTEINLYKYRSKCEFDKLDLKFSDINSLNDPFEGGCYRTNKITAYFPNILSLCTEKDDILMWSYYGGGHRGMCLEYASKDIERALLKYINQSCHFSNIVFAGNKNIDYKPRISFAGAAIQKSSIAALYTLIRKCFEKNARFKHENEFRYLMISLGDGEDKFVDCDPTEVELGCYNGAIPFRTSVCDIKNLK